MLGYFGLFIVAAAACRSFSENGAIRTLRGVAADLRFLGKLFMAWGLEPCQVGSSARSPS
jgi:hypothetical protein